ncbi:uncharacterized protein LOC113228487 [Hyposmocoma kahamanoa]|uniref:uncharacterized protein LOC113228487 n=1 Tax=Hyposmocoma kahamanoa TaxID=1477025 RepID=UPI000E6D921F|nr:uncharacterized protein LOC113228487 [Hyposmocoma kahamanoa]
MADNGPQPRIKYKKVQKRYNGADQFRDDHFKNYDIHNERDGDAVRRVRRHNKTFPKLIDELKKRKSITTITTISLKDVCSDFHSNCSACAKLVALRELQRLNMKRRCPSRKLVQLDKEGDAANSPVNKSKNSIEKPSLHRRKLSGIKKISGRSKLLLNVKRISNRSCQCVIEHKHNETSTTLRATKSSQRKTVEDVAFEETDPERHGEEQSVTNTSIQQIAKVNSKQNLKSRNPSNSTYNSYLSIDHEPMDYN